MTKKSKKHLFLYVLVQYILNMIHLVCFRLHYFYLFWSKITKYFAIWLLIKVMHHVCHIYEDSVSIVKCLYPNILFLKTVFHTVYHHLSSLKVRRHTYVAFHSVGPLESERQFTNYINSALEWGPLAQPCHILL